MLSEKGLEFADNYRLMGVCNPNSARQFLEANPDLGLLIPCQLPCIKKIMRTMSDWQDQHSYFLWHQRTISNSQEKK
ncbi:MAG: DUF302 domain-containing protein [Nitrosopumilus sp.]